MELLQRYSVPKITIKQEYLAILFSLFVFLQFPWLSRMIDISSAAIDSGALSAVALAVLTLLLFKALTWWLIRNIWPVFYQYSTDHFERNFKSLQSWQKIIIYLSFYLLLLFSFVAVLAALV